MIQKRFQFYSSEGIKWTEWFNYREDNGELAALQKEEQWQLKNKLRNEFKIV